MTEILMQDNIDNVLTIAGRTQLVQVVKYKADACYQAHIDTVGAAPSNIHCSMLWEFMAFNSIAENSPTESKKTVFNNEVTCYRDPNTVSKLAEVARQFEPSLWTNTGITVDLLENQWMDIPLVANWEEKFKAENAKMYPLRLRDREIVDTKFD